VQAKKPKEQKRQLKRFSQQRGQWVGTTKEKEWERKKKTIRETLNMGWTGPPYKALTCGGKVFTGEPPQQWVSEGKEVPGNGGRSTITTAGKGGGLG